MALKVYLAAIVCCIAAITLTNAKKKDEAMCKPMFDILKRDNICYEEALKCPVKCWSVANTSQKDCPWRNTRSDSWCERKITNCSQCKSESPDEDKAIGKNCCQTCIDKCKVVLRNDKYRKTLENLKKNAE